MILLIFVILISILLAGIILWIIFLKKKVYSRSNFENIKLDYKVIIAGCCRDVESYISNSIKIINDIGNNFKDYTVIIYENDSSDNTRNILTKLKKANYYYIFEDDINIPKRTERISRGRNKILEKLFEINKTKYHDFLIMIDLDDRIQSGKIIDTINTCFTYKDWDVLTANSSIKYYDIWAYRKKGEKETDCWIDFDNDVENGMSSDDAYNKNVGIFLKPKPISNNLISVESAFGAVAVYKIESIGDCRYEGIRNGNEICEHVPFHECLIKNNKKIFINTKMLID